MKKIFTQYQATKPDMTSRNHVAMLEYYAREGARRRLEREQELASGMPMTERELIEKNREDIEALEKRLTPAPERVMVSSIKASDGKTIAGSVLVNRYSDGSSETIHMPPTI